MCGSPATCGDPTAGWVSTMGFLWSHHLVFHPFCFFEQRSYSGVFLPFHWQQGLWLSILLFLYFVSESHQWMLLPAMLSCCLISLGAQAWKRAVPLRRSGHASCQGPERIAWHECPTAPALLRLTFAGSSVKQRVPTQGFILIKYRDLLP